MPTTKPGPRIMALSGAAFRWIWGNLLATCPATGPDVGPPRRLSGCRVDIDLTGAVERANGSLVPPKPEVCRVLAPITALRAKDRWFRVASVVVVPKRPVDLLLVVTGRRWKASFRFVYPFLMSSSFCRWVFAIRFPDAAPTGALTRGCGGSRCFWFLSVVDFADAPARTCDVVAFRWLAAARFFSSHPSMTTSCLRACRCASFAFSFLRNVRRSRSVMRRS